MALLSIYCIIILDVPLFAGAFGVAELSSLGLHRNAVLHLAVFIEFGIVEMGVSIGVP
jgi:hypothetical protein